MIPAVPGCEDGRLPMTRFPWGYPNTVAGWCINVYFMENPIYRIWMIKCGVAKKRAPMTVETSLNMWCPFWSVLTWTHFLSKSGCHILWQHVSLGCDCWMFVAPSFPTVKLVEVNLGLLQIGVLSKWAEYLSRHILESGMQMAYMLFSKNRKMEVMWVFHSFFSSHMLEDSPWCKRYIEFCVDQWYQWVRGTDVPSKTAPPNSTGFTH